MTNSEIRDVSEMHGCLVCARLFNAPAIYQPDGVLLMCKVTSTGGFCAQDKRQPLVAYDGHSIEKIETAQK